MAWEQILGVIAVLLGAGGVGALIKQWFDSKNAVDGAALDRTVKALDETREEVTRLGARTLTLEDQYRKLWDEHIALQRAHADLMRDHAAERARWLVRERELETEVTGLKARVAELERTNAATADQPPTRAGDD